MTSGDDGRLPTPEVTGDRDESISPSVEAVPPTGRRARVGRPMFRISGKIAILTVGLVGGFLFAVYVVFTEAGYHEGWATPRTVRGWATVVDSKALEIALYGDPDLRVFHSVRSLEGVGVQSETGEWAYGRLPLCLAGRESGAAVELGVIDVESDASISSPEPFSGEVVLWIKCVGQ